MPSKFLDIATPLMIIKFCNLFADCETFAPLRVGSPTWDYLYVINWLRISSETFPKVIDSIIKPINAAFIDGTQLAAIQAAAPGHRSRTLRRPGPPDRSQGGSRK